MKYHSSQSGYALLVGVLVSAILLSIGLSMFNITLKQVELATTARESQLAIYAADTGLQCALYWDLNGTVSQFDSVTPGSGITCLNTTITSGSQTISGDNGQPSVIGGQSMSIFQLNFPNQNHCSIVRVEKTWNAGLDKMDTVIEARGYNTCDKVALRFERALEVSY